MPINTIFQAIHIRSKTNRNVMQNIDRLYVISQTATTPQELLDALHPWQGNTDLYFHNAIPVLIALSGIIIFIISLFFNAYIPFSYAVIFMVICALITYLVYEPRRAIHQIIQQLEMKMKLLKFDIHYNQVPRIIATPSTPIALLSRLQLHFPIFNLGNYSNDFEHYAASTWQCDNGHTHPILLFKYHYASERLLPHHKFKASNLKLAHYNLWGAFVFNTAPLGLAITSKRQDFFRPYVYSWKTSDIHLNKILKIFGTDQNLMAKTISPQLTLKLEPLFLNQEADLISHHQEHILCYVTKRNIFSTQANRTRNQIKNISDLRGYLRTLDMPHYAVFKSQLLDVLTVLK